jgi:hypothetical protein
VKIRPGTTRVQGPEIDCDRVTIAPLAAGGQAISVMWDRKSQAFRIACDGTLLIMPTASNSMEVRAADHSVWRAES